MDKLGGGMEGVERPTPGSFKLSEYLVAAKEPAVELKVGEGTPTQFFWDKVYSDVASNAFGVLLGLIGGIWGLVWILKKYGLAEFFKELSKNTEDTKELAEKQKEALSAILDRLGKLEEQLRLLEATLTNPKSDHQILSRLVQKEFDSLLRANNSLTEKIRVLNEEK